MAVLLTPYNTQKTIYFPMLKRGLVDLAQSADWTPATGDTKITKDGGTLANTTNNPAIVAGTNGVVWSLVLTATEMSCARAVVQIVDSATKAVEDQFIDIATYGNASAAHVFDLGTALASQTVGTVTTVSDKTGYALSNAGVDALFVRQLTEAYAADGAAPTVAQALMLIQQVLTEFAITTTSYRVNKLDGTTQAAVLTLNDATTPTAVTRTT